MIEREPDHRKLSTKLKVKSNKPYRKNLKKANKKDYEPNSAMAEAFEKAKDSVS